MGHVIQTASPNDIPRIFEISSTLHRFHYDQLIDNEHKAEFLAHYQDSQNKERFTQAVLRKLSDPSYTLLTLLTDGLIAGYISIQQDDARNATLHSLFVDAAYQGKGFGAALMSEIVKRFGNKHLTLEVLKKNERAIRLYETFDFIPVAAPSDATFYGAPLLVMTRPPKASRTDI